MENQQQNQLPPINRHGQCPNCEHGWDGGDIVQELSKLDLFKGNSQQEMLKIAGNYGYTETNPTRFSKLESVELPNMGSSAFWRCPKCRHVWDKITNHHYVSLNQALGLPDNQTIIEDEH